ncbi:MAG: SUMF1/EgtB/PvdO family nonheme iron enzyme [Fimbriimonadaceae bacterium]|nr:SUMF1/EgtB/PvdO family nonheme iron enzyme [Chitinophagales bacterium]
MKRILLSATILFFVGSIISSCAKRSSTTGFKYNDPKYGGFEAHNFEGQPTGPNLVLVEGGTYTMGTTEQDVTFEFHNVPRRVTVSSMYMDETEVSNLHYREYLYWLTRAFYADFPDVVKRAYPDTLVWRDELAYNEPYVEYYFRYPSYDNYPVVGISWLQATEYARWRTDRVNENILNDKGIVDVNINSLNEDNFNTESYLYGQYTTGVQKGLKDYSPEAGDSKEGRQVKMEDGVLLPDYRLPTEAEWEYAALGLIGNQVENNEMLTDRRLYPWDGNTLREPSSKERWAQGGMLANYKRGRGDYAGLAGKLNDNSIVTAPIYSYMPNDYGLFNMAGNVNEWVMDVYRPLTYYDMDDLNPFRGNEFEVRELDEEGLVAEKDSVGRIKYRPQKDEEVVNRRNYKKGDEKNYVDGDSISLAYYDYAKTTLISDKSRVYKGGSWTDEAFWLSPGARRYLEEDQSTATLGFRCCMIRLGGDVDNFTKGGNQFKKTEKQAKVNKKMRKQSN